MGLAERFETGKDLEGDRTVGKLRPSSGQVHACEPANAEGLPRDTPQVQVGHPGSLSISSLIFKMETEPDAAHQGAHGFSIKVMPMICVVDR